ncbi:MAG: hypothetical protein NC311_14930 [Muribaculaceae bacterium]|nr:hypothetical protein [Muribaculaceae bacterium]
MEMIKSWWDNRKRQEEKLITEANRNEFAVTERSGKLFLTHNGVAFMQIGQDTVAGEIAQLLNKARDTAQTYRSL